MINFDPNRRIDPLLHDTDSIENVTFERVAKIALPFFCLHSVTGMIASVGMGSFQAGTIVRAISNDYTDDSWLVFSYKSFHLIAVVTSTALSILFPLGQLVLSNTCQLCFHLYTLFMHLRNLEGVEAVKTMGLILSLLIYIASVWIASVEWIALSLLIQAATEMGRAYQEYSREGLAHLPEIIAVILLASIRIYSARPHLQTLHRNYFGKQLSQSGWFNLYGEIDAARVKNKRFTLVDVEAILIQRGISSHIKDVSFRDTPDLTRLKFSNMHFEKCDFSRVCFNDSAFTRVALRVCKLQETSFLMTSVKDSVIAHSDLTDCLLLDAAKQFVIKNCTPNRITKPLVGICWNFKQSGIFTPMIDTALRKHGAIPLRFEYMPDDVNPELLSREVDHLIAEVEAAKPQEMLSIPDEILKRAGAGSEIARIKVRAENYLKQCDGLALPGGLDIEPEFYQARRGAETFSDPDPRRSVTEFALLSIAHRNKIPTMGTCRGSQLINVYFGGTLKQHVPGQSGLQQMEFTNSSRKEWMRALVGDGFHGYSAHHQASDRMGKELEVVMQAEGIKKFFISRDGNFIGSQIHPEIHSSLEQEKEMVKNLLHKKGIAPDEELKNLLAFYEKTIQGNKNIYKFFMEKTARRTSL